MESATADDGNVDPNYLAFYAVVFAATFDRLLQRFHHSYPSLSLSVAVCLSAAAKGCQAREGERERHSNATTKRVEEREEGAWVEGLR